MPHNQDQPIACEDRVKRIVAWLVRNQSRLMTAERVQVTFNCAGKKVRTEIVEVEEA